MEDSEDVKAEQETMREMQQEYFESEEGWLEGPYWSDRTRRLAERESKYLAKVAIERYSGWRFVDTLYGIMQKRITSIEKGRWKRWEMQYDSHIKIESLDPQDFYLIVMSR
ncbi:MAG: hypothetical protein ACREA7_04945 [Nitrosotalea sp.]